MFGSLHLAPLGLILCIEVKWRILEKALRAAALMANGVTPVEPNPDFLDDVRAAAGGKVTRSPARPALSRYCHVTDCPVPSGCCP